MEKTTATIQGYLLRAAAAAPAALRRRRFAPALLALAVAAGVLLLPRVRAVFRVPVNRLASCFRHEVWLQGEIPPVRGCLLDRNGRPLAWSTRHFALYWRVPERRDAAREELAILASHIPGILARSQDALAGGARELLLRDELAGGEMQALSRLRGEIPGLEIRSRTVRRHVPAAALAARLGAVQVVDGVERGVSGEELANDERLRGSPGRFRVKVDKQGRWIPESWQKTAEMRPGYDVCLPVSQEATALAAAR